jgi:hypothetical protein
MKKEIDPNFDGIFLKLHDDAMKHKGRFRITPSQLTKSLTLIKNGSLTSVELRVQVAQHILETVLFNDRKVHETGPDQFGHKKEIYHDVPLKLPFAEGWDVATNIGTRIPTGLSFIDCYINGGAAPGESYSILGAFGAGKTTLGVMITTTSARLNYEAWVQGGRQGVPARAFHFYYEDPTDDILLLALSYMAAIPKDRMELLIRARDPSLYSTAGNYQQYELDRNQSIRPGTIRQENVSGTHRQLKCLTCAGGRST